MSMIKYLQLPVMFNVDAMKADLQSLAEQGWKLHYNTRDYAGEWSALPLRSAGGNIDNILAHSNEAASFDDTILMKACPYIQQVVDYFQCPKLSVRLLKLKAGAVVHPHSDQDLYYEEGEARIHVPIVTNDKVEFYLEEERIFMKEGECWYMNLALKHRLQNNSDTDRVHLVIDCVVNDWIKAWFNDERIEVRKTFSGIVKPGHDEATKRQIIEMLRLQNTATANKMAAEIEQELSVQ